MAFASNLNEKSSEATRRLKESLHEFPATTWNDVYNRYNTKLRIEEDTISHSRKKERVSSRRAETEKRFGKNKYDPYMGPAGRDSRSKQDNSRYDHRLRYRESGSSSRFEKERNARETQDDDRGSKAKNGGYNFNVSTSDLVAVLRSMGDKQGYLTKLFSENSKQAYIKNMQEPPKPPLPKRTVNVISREEEINGVTYTIAKKVSKITVIHMMRVQQVLEEESITFDDADADGMLTPHKDSLVISLLGHDTNVKRVLIDPGYNQIKMDPIDEEKTSFITNTGTYCYKVMPFGLKNAGATYQRLVTEIFQEHLGKTMEVYIYDMLVKSQPAGDHIQHLSDTFQILRKFNMKLNPEKCAFGVSSGKFLGFLVSNRGIEVNPVHIKVIEESLDTLTSKKEVQRLIGRIAALGRFISKSSEKCFRTAIKSQVLADFVADFSQGIQLEVEKELQVFNGSNPRTWTLFTDGLSNVKEAGLGIVLVPPTGETIRQAIKCHPITNNEAEYEDVIACLELSQELGIEQFIIKSDSQLVVNQMLGTYIAREARMQQYLEKARDLVRITSTPYHPVGNGQVESMNKVIINNLKKRLEESKGNWPKVLPGVLWAYRTTAKISTGETPFSLVYGAKALILVEIGEPSTRYTQATEESNEEEMRVKLDLLEERRETALIRMAAQKQVMERYYNQKAHLRYFKIGDFLLKKVFQSTRAANAGKLSATWEGPYKIHGIAGKEAYEMETMDDKILPSNWNVVHLKRYYF
ncbi:uncharacterized protein [Nicotiana sylvestris]|uniref:uncharacterized protein n=1 Tax=Nicotiana sylvestris TaxID=4096 RepID=UPI00388C878D